MRVLYTPVQSWVIAESHVTLDPPDSSGIHLFKGNEIPPCRLRFGDVGVRRVV